MIDQPDSIPITPKLCCVLSPMFICDGCNKHWCKICALPSNRGAGDHATVEYKDPYLVLATSKHLCRSGVFVYSVSTSARVSPPYHLVLKDPNESTTLIPKVSDAGRS